MMPIDAHHRCDIGTSKSTATPFHNFSELGSGHLIGAHKLLNNGNGHLRVSIGFPRGQLIRGNGGYAIGDKETAVGGEALQDDRAKIKALVAPSSRTVGDRSHGDLYRYTSRNERVDMRSDSV